MVYLSDSGGEFRSIREFGSVPRLRFFWLSTFWLVATLQVQSLSQGWAGLEFLASNSDFQYQVTNNASIGLVTFSAGANGVGQTSLMVFGSVPRSGFYKLSTVQSIILTSLPFSAVYGGKLGVNGERSYFKYVAQINNRVARTPNKWFQFVPGLRPSTRLPSAAAGPGVMCL
ncbi:fatty acid desaturase [Endozoicomonas sp. NE40]|uniref:Fatty acid desaturase n=1 Tax=Endozoicomonas lisbonensis TaxID=3120522 RepID=A0ABV2SF57_9GAMM